MTSTHWLTSSWWTAPATEAAAQCWMTNAGVTSQAWQVLLWSSIVWRKKCGRCGSTGVFVSLANSESTFGVLLLLLFNLESSSFSDVWAGWYTCRPWHGNYTHGVNPTHTGKPFAFCLTRSQFVGTLALFFIHSSPQKVVCVLIQLLSSDQRSANIFSNIFEAVARTKQASQCRGECIINEHLRPLFERWRRSTTTTSLPKQVLPLSFRQFPHKNRSQLHEYHSQTRAVEFRMEHSRNNLVWLGNLVVSGTVCVGIIRNWWRHDCCVLSPRMLCFSFWLRQTCF